MKVYLAGPLFTEGERAFNRSMRDRLVALGHEVFLPQEKEERAMTTRAIFDFDVAGIEWSDAVVACMDGPDPDSGTCWEVGFTYGSNYGYPELRKKIVLYRTDFRAEREHGPYNLMLHQCADAIVDGVGLSVPEIAAWIDGALRS